MGIEDRDYYQEKINPIGGGFQSPKKKNKWILWLGILIFLFILYVIFS